MKSVVNLEINASRDQVARLLADPANMTRWMDDLAVYEPISGDPGQPGSRFRLVPRRGEPFIATVVARNLPAHTRLELDAPSFAVTVKDDLEPLTADRTRLRSEESFHFKGTRAKVLGLLATWTIKRAHRRHMKAFKRFVERETAS